MLRPHSLPHFSINSFWSRASICDMIIFDLYGPYWGLWQENGLAVPVSMLKLYSKIDRRAPSLKKQPQYFMMKFVAQAHVCESRSGRTHRCFWISFWCKSLVKRIMSSLWIFLKIRFGWKLFYRESRNRRRSNWYQWHNMGAYTCFVPWVSRF